MNCTILLERTIENVIFGLTKLRYSLLMKRIILSVTNDLATDQRVHRIATTLMQNGAKVTLVGRLLPKSLLLQRNYGTYRMWLLFRKGPLFYAEYNVRLFFYLLFAKVDILVSNDLDTLTANYLASFIRKKPLVYDAHEYFTEVPELVGRPFTKNVWKKIEQILLHKIKYSYTVCESIAGIYHKMYGIDMRVVRNLPLRSIKTTPYVTDSHLPKDFVIYQGSLNLGRGLELLIDSFQFISNLKCVIAGNGDLQAILQRRVIAKNLEDRIIFIRKIPFEQLKTITQKAILGISIEENLGLNYYYALPNKLFDYIQAGIPVLVSDFPEMSKIVHHYGVGEVFVSRQAEDLALQIESMVNKGQRKIWEQNLAIAAEELCWENEEKELLKIYEKLL
jgi:glycosyltransferase involved in cell wall biosynthesis